MRINIIDVGIGNVASLLGWANQITEDVILLSTPNLYSNGAIVIPGACASNELMKRLRSCGLDVLIKELNQDKVTVLGICAGFQIMGNFTTENEYTPCIGLLDNNTKALSEEKSTTLWKEMAIKMPKMSVLQRALPRKKILRGRYYFNHRFGVFKKNIRLDYAVQENLIGVQFHPEKSGVFGMPFLRALLL